MVSSRYDTMCTAKLVHLYQPVNNSLADMHDKKKKKKKKKKKEENIVGIHKGRMKNNSRAASIINVNSYQTAKHSGNLKIADRRNL